MARRSSVYRIVRIDPCNCIENRGITNSKLRNGERKGDCFIEILLRHKETRSYRAFLISLFLWIRFLRSRTSVIATQLAFLLVVGELGLVFTNIT